MTADMGAKVAGYCPMGCGSTLFLGHGGYVTCSYIPCPAPDAVSTILEEDESEHIVKLEATTFSVQHPLKERLNGDLFVCKLHGFLSMQDGPPATLGRYRVVWDGATAGGWTPMPSPAGES